MWLKTQEASHWITLLLIFHNIELRRDSRDAEIDFIIDGKVYTPATFECNLDDRGNVWGGGLVINLELED